MADRTGGALRWGAEERTVLRNYLEEGKIDYARLGSSNYLNSLAARERVWKRHIDAGKGKNFRQNVRRAARDYQAETNRQNVRRTNADGGHVRFTNDSDTDGDFKLDSDPDSEFVLLFVFVFFACSNLLLVETGDEDSQGPARAFRAAEAEETKASVETAREERRDQNLEGILAKSFANLQISKSKGHGKMLIYHWYVWQEGVTEVAMVQGYNMGLTRLTIDILLPGPTVLDQLECSITGKRKVKVEYTPPSTYLNARRSAVKSASLSGVGLAGRTPVQQEEMFARMAATSRATGHSEALKKIRPAQKKIVFEIDDLPFDVDPYFCNRDDWGMGPTAATPLAGSEGVQIAFYKHENLDMQHANQFVWILHLELTSTERPEQLASPNRPRGFADYKDYA